jgi:aminoglycoside/choline kinase family phosphotransferase
MSDREALIARFLRQHGWADARRRVLAGDASFRRYDRLTRGGETLVLMDAPPPHEDIRPFVHVARYLADLGLCAPAIVAADDAAGLLLLEDLDDDLFSRVLREGRADERELYEAATDVLIALHRAGARVELPAYDDTIMLEMALLLVDWFAPLAGIELKGRARDDYAALWRAMLPKSHIGPDTVILRDYHADNLVWQPDRKGLARVGLLDFQDAMIGPRAYDLVSLLEDARRDVAPATVTAVLRRYLAAFPDVDPETFATAYAVAGAQRNCRIIGVFCRLFTRDGKPAYQSLLPRVWDHLAHDLEHPANAPLKDWLDRWVPPDKRTRAA